MKINSDLAFNNFIMTQGLEELLRLISNEKDDSKIKQIKRAIHLRVNYIDDNNQKLEGLSLYRHKKKIKEKYRGTPHIKYITFNRSIGRNIFVLSIFLISILGGKFYYDYHQNLVNIRENIATTLKNSSIETNSDIEDLENSSIYDIMDKTYVYKNMKLTERKIEALYNIKSILGSKHLAKENFEEAKLNFLEAIEIGNVLGDNIKIEKINDKMAELKNSVNLYIDKKLVELDEGIDDEAIRKNGNKIIEIANQFEIPGIEKRVFERAGDISLERFSLLTARNYYLLTQKFSGESKILEDKIKNVEILLRINALLQEIKILQLNENPVLDGINRKYDEIIKLNEELDENYKMLDI